MKVLWYNCSSDFALRDVGTSEGCKLKGLAHMDSIPQKRCTECNEYLPATSEYFYTDKRTKRDGLYPCCKPCFLKRAKRSRDKDIDKTRATALKSYYKHHEKRLIAGKRYRDNNPEKWHDKNNKWVKNNPEKARAKTLRRLARLVNAEGTHNGDDIKRLYDEQEGRCGYCGITLFDEYHVDHIEPLSRGGSNWPDNLMIACEQCNLSKASKTLEEWMAIRGW